MKKPIPILYVAVEISSIYGHLYMEAGNITECFVAGKIAGQNAADSGADSGDTILIFMTRGQVEAPIFVLSNLDQSTAKHERPSRSGLILRP